MKKLVSIIILCLGCFGFLEAQDNIWRLLNCDTPFLGAASNGDLFATDEYGCLLRSQDEGETWQIVLGQETGFSGHINSSCFAVSNEGRICVFNDNQQTVVYSDDAGDTWQQTPSISSCAMPDKTGLCVPTNDIFVVWAQEGEIFYTLDGGETWEGWIPDFMNADNGPTISDLLVNENGDVYLGLATLGGDGGISHSTLSDIQNWELVAAGGVNIKDMAFDPEGNVVACGYHIDGSSIGFQHTPGFYLFDGTTLAISDGGIVYRPHFDGNQAVLSYSTDHGEHFTDIGEHLPLVDIAPGGDAYFLIKGHDNHLYFDGGGEYWKCIPDADEITNYGNYVPLVHEGNDRQKWNVVYIASMNYPNDYFTDVQSIRDNIILDGVDYKLAWVKNSSGINIAGAVREEDRRVYFRRKTGQIFQDEVLLYDFNLSMGDTVTVNWTGTPLVVIEESEVEVNGTTRRQLGLAEYSIGLYSQREVEEYWIEGVGSTFGFLNSGYEGWSGTFVHLLCYHENGDLVWDNEAFDDCVMNSDGAPATFAPQGAEWYFDVFNPWGTHPEYQRFYVDGDTIIQGHQCSIIIQRFVETEHDGEEYVYEEDNKVYWFNPTTNAFSTLYDFDAEAGESWYYEVGDCSHQVTVDSVGSVTWNGRTYRTQWVRFNEDVQYYSGKIIEGIGYERGLFPDIIVCNGWEVFDDSEIEYLRCYVEDDEILYHEGDYDCDYVYVNTFCWDGTVADAYAGGDGTPENPYQIATSNQLALLAQQTNDSTGGDAYYELVANINLQRCDGGTIQWVSIGTVDNMFRGHFNGNGNYILNLNQYISDGELEPVGGLFGYTDHAEISNVRMVQCSIRGNGQYVGGIVGYAGLSNISNCSITQSSVKTETGVAGGLVGCADMPFGTNSYPTNVETSYITNCLTDVATWIDGFDCAGGIVGKVNKNDGRNPWVITDCRVWDDGYAAGFSVTSEGNAGGIVGFFRNGTISGCLNQFVVTGGDPGTGGIAGTADLTTIENCTNQGMISGGFAVGGIVGYGYANMNMTYLEIIECVNEGSVTGHDRGQNTMVGGIIGLWGSKIIRCVNKGDVMGIAKSSGFVGGIVGDSDGIVANCYNRGSVTVAVDESVANPELLFVGGISATPDPTIYNVYNTGVVTGPELPASVIHNYGNIIGRGLENSHYLNAYWLDDDDLSACGNVNEPELHGSSAFVQGATSTSWMLNDAQYGTTDLLEALNFGAVTVLDSVLNYPYLCTWLEDVDGTNDGYPVLGPLPGDTIQSGDLLYSIINVYSHKVSVIGHVNGENAQGEIVIPETVDFEGQTCAVTEVAERAFFCYRSIVSVFVPNTVTKIGSNAFYGCSSLQSIHLPEALEVISNGMLSGCYSLSNITLPSTVTEIGGGAFYDCRGLTEIVLPNGVSVIRNEAFNSCVQLHSITFPETMVSIGRMAFFNCSNLTEVMLPLGLTTLSASLFNQCGKLESVVIPESVISIDERAFGDCERLNSIVVPNNVESIGRSAFEGCSSLSLVELGSSVSYLAEEVFLIHSLDVRLSLICHNPIPAQCSANTFPSGELQGTILVPCETGEAYRQAWGEYWTSGNFEEDCDFMGSEWYYEIENEDGSITYQYLESAADTTVNDKTVTIIIRTNTLYDKSGHTEVTHEYIYEENEVVYWWNKDLQEFAVLYDLGAEVGDGWEIKVGTTSLVMHVDAVESIEYEGRTFKTLQVSDAEDLFSGTIVCGIGHLTSFFPERLMTRGKGYRVEGIRCYWRNGELVFKYGDKDCDEVYMEYHNGIEETDEVAFAVYPNPTDGVLYVETFPETSPINNEYRITNLMGQTVLTGSLNAETQQIDVSTLPQGMYFITISGTTMKFMAQ